MTLSFLLYLKFKTRLPLFLYFIIFVNFGESVWLCVWLKACWMTSVELLMLSQSRFKSSLGWKCTHTHTPTHSNTHRHTHTHTYTHTQTPTDTHTHIHKRTQRNQLIPGSGRRPRTFCPGLPVWPFRGQIWQIWPFF